MSWLQVVALLVLSPLAHAAEPSPEELVRTYDQTMAPSRFDGLFVVVAHRPDGTERGYKMRVMKSAEDKVRMWFFEPAAAKGQEMLSVSENMWVYMPNLKRALRIASRDSFQGGDFNNGDLMRLNYARDYAAKTIPSGSDDLWALELTARSSDATYDRIKLWMTKPGKLPSRAEYYAASGKLLRSATFDMVKNFRGLTRPSHIVMRNELTPKRFSEMTTLDLRLDVAVPEQRFVLDDLGR